MFCLETKQNKIYLGNFITILCSIKVLKLLSNVLVRSKNVENISLLLVTIPYLFNGFLSQAMSYVTECKSRLRGFVTKINMQNLKTWCLRFEQ